VRGALCCSVAIVAGMLAACQTPPDHEQLVVEQLEAVVHEQSPECIAVRVHQRVQRLDYRVVCQSGSVYLVRVQPDGRVTVKRDDSAAPPLTPR
jgi:hypothetical protein